MQKTKKDNITHLNKYSLQKTLDNIRNYKRKKVVRIRTTAIVLGGALLIGLVSLPILENNKITEKLQAERVLAEEKLATLESEQAELEYQVGLLEDEEYVAKLARKELNLSKPNEILINLPVEEKDAEETSDKEE